jgi:hypothetical protein
MHKTIILALVLYGWKMDLAVPDMHYDACCSSLFILSRILSRVLGLEQHRYAL